MTDDRHHQWDGPVAPNQPDRPGEQSSPNFQNYTCSKCGIDALSQRQGVVCPGKKK